jgi:serine/threonine-protein kinase
VVSDSRHISGVHEGQIIAGKYRIERVLGAGGMGVVVAAHHLLLDEKVAIKFLLPETLKHAETVGRFAREARAAAKIKSEHVARVIDVGELESGAPYIVMEFLDGSDLAAWIRERGPLPIELAVDFVLQGCEAVAEAHRLGIVHRDLKPANLFIVHRLDGQYAVKVLDFGISKFTGSAATSGAAMTTTAAVMGSPLYMSPEQMHSARTVDARTDVWALGVVLYEALAGAPPFRAETLPELCAKILATAPAPLRSVRPEVPRALEAVVEKCLEKDREKRFRTVGDLAAPLAEFGSDSARLSARRIAGVLQGAGRRDARLDASRREPTASREVTLTAPALELGGPLVEDGPATRFVGTAGPVATTLAGRKRTSRASRLLVFGGAAVLALVGMSAVWLAGRNRDATPVTGGPVSMASHAASSTEAPLSSDPAPARSIPVSAPPEPLPTPGPVGSARAGPALSPSSSRSPTPRSPARPNAKSPTPPIATVDAVSASAAPAPTAPAPNASCRVVSSYDARGREHFTEVCDGN